MIERVHIIGATGRVGSAVSARLAERGVRLDGRLARPRPALRPRPRDRRGRVGDRHRPVGRARQRRNSALGARPARAQVRPPPPAVVLEGPWAGAARRRVGRGDRRVAFGPHARDLARRDARAADRSMLDDRDRAAYHAGAAFASNYLVTLRTLAGSLLEAVGCTAGGARPAHARRHRRWLRAHGADRPR